MTRPAPETITIVTTPEDHRIARLTAAAIVVQFTLGKLEIADVHIFLGVLIAMLTTAVTSWTYRRPPPTESAG